MNKKIKNVLVSVYHKDGLEPLIQTLKNTGARFYATGGTQQYLEKLGCNVTPVESLTGFPSILGGRVKTLHPAIFGGILAKRNDPKHQKEMKLFQLPEIDLVIVDLYPFENTLKQEMANSSSGSLFNEEAVIEKIDIGGSSLIRSAAKNFTDVAVVASSSEYDWLNEMLLKQSGELSLEQRRQLAVRAFQIVAHYDFVIAHYFSGSTTDYPFPAYFQQSVYPAYELRYGENPHQKAKYYGNLNSFFQQLSGKEISYNNLADLDAAIQLMHDLELSGSGCYFAIIKHTNVCGVAKREKGAEAWKAALAGDPESAFGGILITNHEVDEETAALVNEIFFEVLLAPSFSETALQLLKTKKNRILLQTFSSPLPAYQYKTILNGVLVQETDSLNFSQWNETGGRNATEQEKEDLQLANIICKHLKSNAIAIVKNGQMIGKGCGQTSRIDAVRQAIEKAKQFHHELQGAVLASDAFFPFDDAVKLAHQYGITAFIQPGGSIRDNDTIEYCRHHHLALVLTATRHFRH
ncbi:MAG: bifunctional phosphoribosylaminoimidazolecarboxamide formyltransferase/IMP cyclohydrolase [Chitinophagaceae bacterium]|nr:bifunctional phosphoribosylaminoimidazolecarboxamide formyltransferase/IMP cyclohydrolase [Chitinophagaceae bacterium]